MKDTKLLTIIVTYNGAKWIKKCIQSVLNSTIKSDVYVVDNGSTDNTLSIIQSHFPEVILIKSDKNLGFGAANNYGIIYALENNYDYIYLLNQDAYVSKNAFEELIILQKENPEYGIISPIQINDSGELDKNFFGICPKSMFSDYINGNVKVLYDVHEVMAAHWLISRECIETVGGFSPSFPHYGEDTNYVNRLHFHNLKIAISPNTKCVHDREFRPISKEKIYYLQYIWAITLASQLNKSIPLTRIIFMAFIKNSLSMRSIIPIKYMFKFIRKYNAIRKNRLLSKQPMAFIY